MPKIMDNQWKNRHENTHTQTDTHKCSADLYFLCSYHVLVYECVNVLSGPPTDFEIRKEHKYFTVSTCLHCATVIYQLLMLTFHPVQFLLILILIHMFTLGCWETPFSRIEISYYSNGC